MTVSPRQEGPHGWADEMEVGEPEGPEVLCQHLINAPVWHPMWSQYALVVVRLRDGIPGMPPPDRKFPGATHEMIVMALNPERGSFGTGAEFLDFMRASGIPYLTPINIAEQFQAADDEIRHITKLAARAVISGFLNPETAGAPEIVREQWLTSMTKTLAHIRGEAHAQ